MRAPLRADRVDVEHPRADLVGLAGTTEAGDASVRIPRDRERLGHGLPPGAQHLDAAADVRGVGRQRGDRVPVARLGGRDVVVHADRREEVLPHRAVLDEVEHVGRVAPQLGAGRRAHLAAQTAPRGGAVGAVRAGIERLEPHRRGLADRVVHDEPVAAELDERQRPQPGERVAGRLAGQLGAEQRQGRPAGDGRRLEDAPRVRIQRVEVRPRDLLDDRPGRGLLERDARAVADRGAGEDEAERMPAHDAVHPARVLTGEAGGAQDRLRAVGREVLEAHDAHEVAVLAQPGVRRRLAAREHDAHVGGQLGDERPPHPRVEHREELVGVHEEQHPPLLAEPVAERRAQALLRRLHLAPVERDHRDALRGGLAGQPAHERGLADPRDPADVRHDGPVAHQGRPQRRLLALAPHDGACTAVQQGLDVRGHGWAPG